MSEKIVDDGQTVWSGGASVGTCTLDDDSTVFKIGTESAELILAADATAYVAGATTGILAYSTGAFANDDLGEYTHVKLWFRSSIRLAAGDFQIGFSDAADESGTEYFVDLPAITTRNTWHRVIIDLSTGDDPQGHVASVSSIHLHTQ